MRKTKHILLPELTCKVFAICILRSMSKSGTLVLVIVDVAKDAPLPSILRRWRGFVRSHINFIVERGD